MKKHLDWKRIYQVPMEWFWAFYFVAKMFQEYQNIKKMIDEYFYKEQDKPE